MPHPDQVADILAKAEAEGGCRIPEPYDAIAARAVELALAPRPVAQPDYARLGFGNRYECEGRN